MMSDSAYPTVDVSLARRLERAEGMASAACVDARRGLQPQVGAEWIDVNGVFAMFDGITSPLTQSFGLGLVESFTAAQLDEVENFFLRHHSPVAHEISSFATPTTMNLVSARGYTPIESSVVSVRPTNASAIRGTGKIAVRLVDDADTDVWARVSSEGLRAESKELGAFLEDFGILLSRVPGVYRFLAEIDGRGIATGSLTLRNGVALFSGASTVPEARKQGAQQALLESRLAFAADHGIELAMIVTSPGSTSQRNAERQGFRAAFMRSKWQRCLE
ncbi:MAG: hypothetical protein ABJB74_16685 [Gemmatimonas sp.]